MSPLTMQRQQYHRFLPRLLACFRSRLSRCTVVLLAAAGIWLPSLRADGPTLSVQQSSSDRYLVSWPASVSAAYSLYSTTDPVNGPWKPVPGTQTLVDDQWQVSLSTLVEPMYLRLQTTLRPDSSNPR